MRSRTCHYSLANRGGLAEHRCPECGGEFDPTDPNSYLTDRQILVDRLQRYSGILGLSIALLTILVLATITHRPILLTFMLPAIITVAILTWKHRPLRTPDS